ncbi:MULTISPECIES: nitroreductase family protein [Acinetobacter]|jgi:Predicted oxidoreductase related to nitroreductase|uniref:Nitroreductase family protein n=1 Tax=Acinetobacter variabilis TaxID=70346 RepID=A0A7T7WLL4_9GAMM|nr:MULTISPECIES: nitroreductase family protein [Acinetobacter]EXA59190.1 nitroreductase family protein [Acinetobacter baumannii 348935]MCU4363681.1 nitroreductase family protein [Acinetobacter variabilis]MCU4373555.1 nitroreductase family protein [Acinetobacter variabilis]MCU4628245.1 nitroreductase family protein [Acinetobacter variabilis]QKW82888.1 nitroreductase family protein [Acinetobacter sp. FDAARGOS_724]
MSNQFLDLITKRRTIYAIGKNVEQSPEYLTDLIQNAIKQSPSSFNSQSSRAVILFNGEHEKFWGFVADKLKSYAKDEESAAKTTAKMATFAAGTGTVLFFEDQNVVKGLQEQFPSYAENFPIWAEHSTAIAQFSTWTALHTEGLGASLQHYNPIVDEQVHAEWDIPENWKLRAQLVFGSVEGEARAKDYLEDDQRFKVFQ